MPPLRQLQPVIAFAAAHLDEDLSLATLAAEAGLSAFHLHRVFSAAAGETPKQFTLRLRLERAALLLLMGQDSVLNVALSCGFQSHEAFCRAFRRRFKMSPGVCRARGFATSVTRAQAEKHAALVTGSGPCAGLFHRNEIGKLHRKAMTYTITKRQLSPQPVLVIRRRVKSTGIATMLAEALGEIFIYAQQTGTALAGQPFMRILEWGPGVMTVEAGIPIVAPPSAGPGGERIVKPDTLPGGLAATATHMGPYDKLAEAHGAIQVWIEDQGLVASGAPWESYVTDPADYPDPADWKTEVFWPIAS
jgi:AraC family transcriptional regulator